MTITNPQLPLHEHIRTSQ